MSKTPLALEIRANKKEGKEKEKLKTPSLAIWKRIYFFLQSV